MSEPIAGPGAVTDAEAIAFIAEFPARRRDGSGVFPRHEGLDLVLSARTKAFASSGRVLREQFVEVCLRLDECSQDAAAAVLKSVVSRRAADILDGQSTAILDQLAVFERKKAEAEERRAVVAYGFVVEEARNAVYLWKAMHEMAKEFRGGLLRDSESLRLTNRARATDILAYHRSLESASILETRWIPRA